jgi:hypothetical protein
MIEARGGSESTRLQQLPNGGQWQEQLVMQGGNVGLLD